MNQTDFILAKPPSSEFTHTDYTPSACALEGFTPDQKPVPRDPALDPRRKAAGEWRPAFLATLKGSANVRLSCQAAGIGRQMAYRWRDRSPTFRREWDIAIEEAVDTLEAAARARALAGDSVLLIFLLKAHRPDIYRETVRHELWIQREAAKLAEAHATTPERVILLAERLKEKTV